MNWDHVPVAPKVPRKTVKKKTAKDIFEFEEADPDEIFADLEDVTTKAEVDDMVHVKVNFPPFQHYKIDKNNIIIYNISQSTLICNRYTVQFTVNDEER